MLSLCKSQNQAKKYTKEENKEATNQTWIQGIHGHMYFQASQQRRKQALANCG